MRIRVINEAVEELREKDTDAQKKLAARENWQCMACGGRNGVTPSTKCMDCGHGSEWERAQQQHIAKLEEELDAREDWRETETCGYCSGSGMVASNRHPSMRATCVHCRGTGLVVKADAKGETGDAQEKPDERDKEYHRSLQALYGLAKRHYAATKRWNEDCASDSAEGKFRSALLNADVEGNCEKPEVVLREFLIAQSLFDDGAQKPL